MTMWVQKSLFQAFYQSLRNPSIKLHLIFCCTSKNFFTHHTTTLNSVKMQAINFLRYLWRFCCIPLLIFPCLYFLFLPGFLIYAMLKLYFHNSDIFKWQSNSWIFGKLLLRCFSCGQILRKK